MLDPGCIVASQLNRLQNVLINLGHSHRQKNYAVDDATTLLS